jgi:hypothetical protein
LRRAPTKIVESWFLLQNEHPHRGGEHEQRRHCDDPEAPDRARLPGHVTIPIRAHIIWTVAMSGQVIAAVQRSDVPSWAPATEYVATPEGSSSAAPVTRPGPSAEKKRRTKFFLGTLAGSTGCVSGVVTGSVMFLSRRFV